MVKGSSNGAETGQSAQILAVCGSVALDRLVRSPGLHFLKASANEEGIVVCLGRYSGSQWSMKFLSKIEADHLGISVSLSVSVLWSKMLHCSFLYHLRLQH